MTAATIFTVVFCPDRRPKPLPEYAVQRQPDGGIVISEEQS